MTMQMKRLVHGLALLLGLSLALPAAAEPFSDFILGSPTVTSPDGTEFMPFISPTHREGKISSSVLLSDRLPHVATNAALKAKATAGLSLVVRDGFYTAGDGGAAAYTSSSVACTLNAGAGDDGSQVKPNSGPGCWLIQPLTEYDIRIWGAKVDGSTDDSIAVGRAVTAFPAGARIFIPATGHSTRLTAGITPSANVELKGVGVDHYLDQPVANNESYAASGSWIKCEDLVNPCVTFANPGGKNNGVNFVYSQPAPGGGWTPTIYPYTIKITANSISLEDFAIVAGTHCIDFEGAGSGNLGKYSYMENIAFDGCFNIGTRFKNVDNTLHLKNLRYTPYWNVNGTGVITYMEANKIDWDLQYVANMQADGIEFYLSKCAMQFTNSTVTNGFGALTFSANEMQFSNIGFNEVAQATCIQSGAATVISGVWSNVLLYGDTGTSAYSGKYLIDLPSDGVNLTIQGLDVGFADGVARVGGGAAGQLKLSGVDVQKYAAVTAGQTAFSMAAGSLFYLSGTHYNAIRPNAGAGAVFAGAGYPGSLHAWTGRQLFTPSLKINNSAVGIVSTQFGEYELNDKLLTFEIKETLTNKGVSVGAATITGLPFGCQDTGVFVVGYSVNHAGVTSWQNYVQGTTVFMGLSGAVNQVGATDANFTNTTTIFGAGQCLIP